MQTQCPHCKSQYNIGAEQVDAFGGFVRCGKCNYKFNVHDQVLLKRYRNKRRAITDPAFNHDSEGLAINGQRIEPQIDAEPEDDGINIRFRELEDDYDERLFEPTLDTDTELDLDAGPIVSIMDEDDETAVDSAADAGPNLNLAEDLSENHDELEDTLASLLEDEHSALEDVDIRASHFAIENTPDDNREPVWEADKDAPEQDWVTSDTEDETAHRDISEEVDEKEVTAGEDERIGEAHFKVKPNENPQPDGDVEPIDEPVPDEDIASDDDQDAMKDQHEEEDIKDEMPEGLPTWEEAEEAGPREPIFRDESDIDVADEGAEESLISLINDDAESSEHGSPSPLLTALFKTVSFLFWTVLSIALAYFLFGQIKDKLYPAYKDQPAVQSMRASVCKYLPCAVVKYDTEAYEIVVSRMDEVRLPKRHLHISIFMMNKSAVEQVYPNILVTLKRLDGSIAGQRVIGPTEYFKSHDSFVDAGSINGQTQVIKPNKLGKVLIKLNNPPSDAVGFEARVVH